MAKYWHIFPVLFLLLCGILNATFAQSKSTRLLVRVDDMGFSHAANVACMEAFRNGIAKSVEVMVPGPWFEEAAKMLRTVPAFDVGVHITLTSEWVNLKWRPLTHCPSITDEDGYFYPMVFKREGYPSNSFLAEADWTLQEIEQEIRAQIELAQKKIPQVSHLTAHMGATQIHAKTKELLKQLAVEYGLDIVPSELGVPRTPRWSGHNLSAAEKELRFIEMLETLQPGSWLTVEHPAYDCSELESVGHVGYENVAEDREGITQVLTSQTVMQVVKKRGIELISYRDLVK
ncbi:MAG: ChbG/HpnK family deacetylase [Saprospiraceae bacterium]|nr:ChbG/HpnK family deacetylase [Saprospiraceae bacterium]